MKVGVSDPFRIMRPLLLPTELLPRNVSEEVTLPDGERAHLWRWIVWHGRVAGRVGTTQVRFAAWTYRMCVLGEDRAF